MKQEPMSLREWNRKLRNQRKAKGGKKRRCPVSRKPFTIYVLALENGYWYIGISVNFGARYIQHCGGTGAWWTKVHKPIRIAELRQTGIKSQRAAERLEDALTLEYAAKYGQKYVRGGKYCQATPNW